MSLSLFRQCGFKWFLMKNVLHQWSTIFGLLNKQKFLKRSVSPVFQTDGLRCIENNRFIFSFSFFFSSKDVKLFLHHKLVSRAGVCNSQTPRQRVIWLYWLIHLLHVSGVLSCWWGCWRRGGKITIEKLKREVVLSAQAGLGEIKYHKVPKAGKHTHTKHKLTHSQANLTFILY